MPESPPLETLVFYDAGCSVCQGFKAFAESRDCARRLRFEPLGEALYLERVSAALQAEQPNSVIALTPEGDELLRTPAVQHVLIQLGGPWKPFGQLLGFLPSAATDRAYRLIARYRKTLQY